LQEITVKAHGITLPHRQGHNPNDSMPHRVFCNSICGGILLAVTTSLEVPI
jgi:hypothetical protein